MEHTFFTSKKLPNGITMISDLSEVHCYLVEGTEKALLIDAMTGMRGLKDFVEGLTALPVELAATHGHLDHIGGAFEFGSCWLHPADKALLEGREHGALEGRLDYVNGQLQMMGRETRCTEEDFVLQCPVMCRPVTAGMVFDLGGRRLEAIEVPGHTLGSVCYLDLDSGDFFAGDACNSNTLIMGEGSATVAQYLEALKALKARQPEIKAFYLFHGITPVDKSCIDDNIGCCEDILSGKDDHIRQEFLGFTGYLAKAREGMARKDGKFGNIMYTEDRIH